MIQLESEPEPLRLVDLTQDTRLVRYYQAYSSDYQEVGRLVRMLRGELGLTLKQASEIVGVDLSNLSKAERGVDGFGTTACRALEALSEERERRELVEREKPYAGSHKVVTELYVPGSVDDLVDRVREDDRSARFELIARAFASRDTEVSRSVEMPQSAVIHQVGKINLDTMWVHLERRKSDRNPHSLRYRGSLEPESMVDDVDAFADRIMRSHARMSRNPKSP